MKLLIVEDSAEMRRLIRRVLAGLATEISECEDGSEALANFARHEPDWVLIACLPTFAKESFMPWMTS
jgi:CheY-like chemotaxis protein